jgi:hypothetical protein
MVQAPGGAAPLALLALLAGCAGYDGRGLVPGQSTLAEVDGLMGPAADKRVRGAETHYYYPRLPAGGQTYVARIGADGRLLGIEQRLTEANIKTLERDTTRADEVSALFGPPWRKDRFANLEREVWTYPVHASPIPKHLYVQFSADGVLREVYYLDDPAYDQTDGGLLRRRR